MKYLFIDLTIIDCETEYSKLCVKTIDDELDEWKIANQIASNLLGTGEENPFGDGYIFEEDSRTVRLDNVEVIPESEYKVLKKYLIEM